MADKSTTTGRLPELETAMTQTLSSKLPIWAQLRWSLIALMVALAVVPVLFILAITLYQAYTTTGNQITQQLDAIAALKRNELTRWLTDAQETLNLSLSDKDEYEVVTTFAQQSVSGVSLTSTPVGRVQVNNVLVELQSRQLYFDELLVYNPKGEIVGASNPVQIGKVVTRQPYFAASLEGKDYIQYPFYELGTNELVLIITHPLVDEESDQIVGILAGRLNLRIMGEIMTERTGLGDNGETYLVSEESNFLLTPSRHPEYSLLQAYHSEGIDTVLEQKTGSTGSTNVYDNYENPPVRVFGSYLWIPELQAGLVAEIDRSQALQPFIGTLVTSILIASGFVLLATLGALYAANRISRPITELTQTATQIATGDLTQRTQLRQRNEIGLLATVFNQMTGQLQELIGSLEERIADRTRRLEIVATMGEHLSAILDFDQLLTELVNQVKERFNYYHAHVYIIDSQHENLVMTAGAGEAGKQMKARGHKIALNAPTSLVARAVRTAEIVTVDNVRQSPDWLPNPLLPDTYSEMAVPIILEGQVVGILDVQERRIAGLDESDANLLRSLANQVAVAIRNARLFAEVEKALAEAHATQERYLERDWDKARIARRNRGQVQFSQTETTLSEDIIAAARQQALADEGLAVVALKGSPGNVEDQANSEAGRTDYALVAPIRLRNVVIGNLQLHGVEPDRQWTEDEQALLEAVIDQVAQAAENIRLLDETQERASRERLIGQVSDRLRRAPNLETLMKIGVEELSRVLQPARTFLRFGLETELLAALGDGSKATDQAVHSTSVVLVDSQEAINGQGDKSHE